LRRFQSAAEWRAIAGAAQHFFAAQDLEAAQASRAFHESMRFVEKSGEKNPGRFH
jgi:hypothetical protein